MTVRPIARTPIQLPLYAYRRAYSRWTQLVLAGVLGLVSPGCNAVCSGPGCEAEWPTARVAVHDGEALRRSTDAWEDAGARYEGLDAQGAGWTIGTLGRSLLFGQPEVGQVLRVPYRAGDGRWERLDKWTGPEDFGTAVAAADVDGNDEVDLLVGAPNAEFGRGAVYLFRNAVGGTKDADDAAVEVRGGTAGDRLGQRIVTCPDLTGDGRPEFLVSMPWFATPPGSDFSEVDVPDLAGGVVLLTSEALNEATGVVDPWTLGPVWWGQAAGDAAGAALACERDLTGDGIADIAIGAPYHSTPGAPGAGRVYVLDGAALPGTGVLGTNAALLDGERGDWLGASLAMLNLDGDRPAELAVGAPGHADGAGRVLILRDRALTRGWVPDIVNLFDRSEASADHFGRWITGGDLDGDGLTDLLVGAPDTIVGRSGFDTGRAWIFRAASRDLWLEEDTDIISDDRLLGTQPFQRVGRAMVARDLTGDGRDDVVLPMRRAARND